MDIAALKTAADFSELVTLTECQLEEARTERGRLKGALDDAVFANGDVEGIKSRMDTLSNDIDLLEVRLEGAKHRRGEAERREAEDDTQRMIAQNAEDEPYIGGLYRDEARLITELREKRAEIDRAERSVERRNAHIESYYGVNRAAPIKLNLKKLRRESLGEPAPLHKGLSQKAQAWDQALHAVASGQEVTPPRAGIMRHPQAVDTKE